jgi:Flp pilus assembly protein TadD
MLLGSSTRAAAGVLVLSLLGACAMDGPPELQLTAAEPLPLSGERPQDQPLQLAKRHYAKGDYGLAERHFRAAVEANPKSSEAWLGLAASYDRLRRFDLAERAYQRVLALEGRNPAVLNNLGYHHMLRGDLNKARAYLNEAARKDPGNPLIQGNLYLLETWKGNGMVADMPAERG